MSLWKSQAIARRCHEKALGLPFHRRERMSGQRSSTIPSGGKLVILASEVEDSF